MKSGVRAASAPVICLAVALAIPPSSHAQGRGSEARVADAAERRDLAAVTALIAAGANVNTAQPDGATALHWAVHHDERQTVDVLVRRGARVDAATDHGVTPLALACENGNAAVVERLLAAGASPNTATDTGITPLMTAARVGAEAAVKVLIARGADVNAAEPTHGQTALMWAVSQQHAAVVAVLLENRADVQARTAVRRRTVQTGNRYGDQNSIKGSVGETDLGGFTPLLFAARVGSVESARHLLDAGAPIDAPAANGATPLTMAAHSGQSAVARYLISRGADVNAAGAGYTPLHAAVLRGDRELLEALLAGGANPNSPLAKGTASRYYSKDYAFNELLIGATPVLLAARYGESEMVRRLADAGADLSIVLPDGTTPLMAAIGVTRGYGAFRAGDRRERYQGPADVAAKVEGEEERGTLAVVQVLLELGVDVAAANKAGDTALHMAAGQSLDTVIPVLVARGAPLDARNQRGQTPLAVTTVGALRGVYAMSTAERAATAALLRTLGAKD